MSFVFFYTGSLVVPDSCTRTVASRRLVPDPLRASHMAWLNPLTFKIARTAALTCSRVARRASPNVILRNIFSGLFSAF